MSQYILPDSAYMPGVIPTFDEIEKNRHASIQWLPQDKMLNAIHTAKAENRKLEFISNVGDPFYHTDNGSIVKPGMLPAVEATTFLAERTYNSVFHQKCNYERIVAKRTKRAYYDVDENLESLTSVQNGKQRVRDDITRDKHIHKDKVLVSEPYVETADFTREDLKNHLTGQRFIQEYINTVSQKRDWNMGMLELYSIRDETATNTDGLHANDGLFKQLDDQYEFMKENIEDSKSSTYGQGYYCGIYGTGTDKVPLDFSKMDKDETGNIVEQMVDMETQYYTQLGNNGQEFLLSPEAFGQLRKIAGRRETIGGDRIFFEGGVLYINGTPITPCMELALPRNGYKQHVLLGNFKTGVTNGFREDFTTEINYDFDTFTYKVSTFVELGTLLEREQDVLAAEVTNLPTMVAQQDDDGDDSP